MDKRNALSMSNSQDHFWKKQLQGFASVIMLFIISPLHFAGPGIGISDVYVGQQLINNVTQELSSSFVLQNDELTQSDPLS